MTERILEKLAYTKKWVDDIYLALQEKDVEVTDYPLELIGNEIRKLHISSVEINTMFAMACGIRSKYLAYQTLTDTDILFTDDIIVDDANNYVYNYFRTTLIENVFSTTQEYSFTTILNEREEY